MDTTILVDKDIESGKILLECLDHNGFDIKVALWFFNPELNKWDFLLSSPSVDKKGARDLYVKIGDKMREIQGDINFTISNIVLLSYKHWLINLMKGALGTVGGISGIRFQGNVINGVLIHDAYIYRLT